jgi:hypothetical protein
MKLTAKEKGDVLRKRHQAKMKLFAAAKFEQRDWVKTGREQDRGYLAFLRRLACVACWAEGLPSGSPIEAAHIRFSDARHGRINPGMQSKPSDRWATPLCRHHHQHDQHKRNERAFWEGLGVEPGDLSIALYAAYLAGADGLQIIRQFVARDAIRKFSQEVDEARNAD